ncbi:MAG: pseudouridine synthase, partial [Gammaproteobacteria bacterium]
GRTDKAPGRSGDRPQDGQRPFEQRDRGFQDRGFNNDRGGFADRGANRGFGDRERSFGDRGDRSYGDRDRGSFAGRPPAGGDRGQGRRSDAGGGFGRPQARPQGRRPTR